MSSEYRTLVETLARRLAQQSGSDVLGNAFDQNGYSDEGGQPIDADGFLDMHRRDVRVVLSSLRAMGKLK